MKRQEPDERDLSLWIAQPLPTDTFPQIKPLGNIGLQHDIDILGGRRPRIVDADVVT